MQHFQKHTGKHGFTLVEVMVVVLIAVLITLASVPLYKRSQDRVRYMAASGVLMQLGTAISLYQEACGDSGASFPVTTGTKLTSLTLSPWTSGVLASCPSSDYGGGEFLMWLQGRNYLQKLPSDESGKTYKGYEFTIYPSGNSKVASMKGSNSLTEYQCADIDKNGKITTGSCN